MGNTKEGGKIAAKTNKSRYGKDFYREIGREGGKKKHPNKGFAAGEEGRARAIKWGSVGGKISRRGKAKYKDFPEGYHGQKGWGDES